ncbi:hypothetical protein NLU13_6004 [Sarocladium strictum]|uniref:Probable dipeptidyl-aminopeptidase B n=1 Tax=Sarocladium strictum TaxID=5046 RepID=A0AA39GF38_SARSR|nr:hypothetical protein NLU13_6004 [Sarocladium strictum]
MASRSIDPPAVEATTRDSLSSVSTTSLVFERLHEQTEKMSHGNGTGAAPKTRRTPSRDDLDDEDPLKDEDYANDDLETGPFLGSTGAAVHNKPVDRKCRRIIILVGSVLVGAWLLALGLAIAQGLYKHAGHAEHDPDSQKAWGSKKQITMDQVFSGFWRPQSRSISWIKGPQGEDGLMIEKDVPGQDYIVVKDVRREKDTITTGDASSSIANSRTLMKEKYFNFGGENYNPSVTVPSPDMKKVLIGVDREKNWRHSFVASYFILDVSTQKVEPLIPNDAKARVQLATWSPKSDAVAFTRNNNLFIRRLTPGKNKDAIVQVTDDGGPEYFYGIPDWVYEEEVLGSGAATWWSEDGKHVAFLRTNETGVPDYPVQYFISRPSGEEPEEGLEYYPETRQIKYPKAGAHNPVVDILYYDVEKAETFTAETPDGFPDDDRIITNVLWAGSKVLLKVTNRISNIVKVILVDVPERKGRTINTMDVDKLDGGWYEISHQMAYIPADPSNGRPQDGYVDSIIHDNNDHLAYFSPLDASEPIMLTSGDWEVVDAPSAVDPVSNRVYFIATKESSIQRHVYSVKLDGSDLKPLTDTSSEGWYDASFSTGAGFVVLNYEGPKVPFQKVVSTPSSKVKYNKVLEDNADLAERAKKHELPLLKYGVLDIGDGVKLNYLERRPRDFNPNKQYPVLFQQYSGPGSQSVKKRFAVDFHSYVAASLGYVVITVDPRGTGFLGRKHRVAVHGHLGVIEAQDHIAAAKHFASQRYVDADRLAIWGWSYGGFQTLKTLELDAGGTYSYGMAVAPVTDWRFYDSIYTERYMGTPQDNADGYDATKISNATALGENVRFLLMHGVADDNVHFQNSMILLDNLDLAGVENYDVHVFPDSDHSIYFHQANRIVYDKLRNWLINAFNGEWLKIADPKPLKSSSVKGKEKERRDVLIGPMLES